MKKYYNFLKETNLWDEFHELKSKNPKNPQLIYERDPDKNILDRLVYDLDNNAKILDLGCGDGVDSIYLKEKGFDVYALDLSSVAINNLKESGINSKVYDIKTADLPFSDDYFDLIYSRLALHYFDRFELSQILHNIKNKMKDGSTLYITSKTQSFKDKIQTGKQFLHKKEWLKILGYYFTDIHITEHSGRLYNIPSTWLEIECYN